MNAVPRARTFAAPEPLAWERCSATLHRSRCGRYRVTWDRQSAFFAHYVGLELRVLLAVTATLKAAKEACEADQQLAGERLRTLHESGDGV